MRNMLKDMKGMGVFVDDIVVYHTTIWARHQLLKYWLIPRTVTPEHLIVQVNLSG